MPSWPPWSSLSPLMYSLLLVGCRGNRVCHLALRATVPTPFPDVRQGVSSLHQFSCEVTSKQQADIVCTLYYKSEYQFDNKGTRPPEGKVPASRRRPTLKQALPPPHCCFRQRITSSVPCRSTGHSKSSPALPGALRTFTPSQRLQL